MEEVAEIFGIFEDEEEMGLGFEWDEEGVTVEAARGLSSTTAWVSYPV